MFWLSNSTLARLRDQLQARGRRPSIPAPGPDMTPEAVQMMEIVAEYGPLCEAMYLMMSADGRVTDDEREVLRGALRNLSSDRLRTAQIDSMVERAAKNASEHGRDARMQAVALALREDRVRGEVAFVLAAAIAFADNAIADQENDTLSELAEGLGIDEARANNLLDTVESDMGAGRR
jgi:uncharacterized tellurite resistance protein B-like protein